MKRIGLTLAAALAAFALVGAGCGGDDDDNGGTATETTDTTTTDTETGTATDTTETGSALTGTVGPGFTITLTTADGAPVETLSAGSYELEVEDLSSAHNFHLTGPGGVDVATDVAESGTQSFTVDVTAGTYDFVCDPHASQMSGSFQVE
jgi:plastocyanin